jgi:hypothetical protein
MDFGIPTNRTIMLGPNNDAQIAPCGHTGKMLFDGLSVFAVVVFPSL